VHYLVLSVLQRWRDLPLLLRGSATSIGALGVAQGATIGVEAAVAKQLGPASLGALAIGATISSVFAVTIIAACVVAVARSVAYADEQGDFRRARNYLVLGITFAITTSVPTAVALLVWREGLNSLLGGALHGDAVIAMFALALPWQAVAGVALAANRAFSRISADFVYLFVDAVIRSLAIPALALFAVDVRTVASLCLMGAVVAFPFALAPVLHVIRFRNLTQTSDIAQDLRGFGTLAGWQILGSGVWACARRADLLAVSFFGGAQAAGIYRLALLLASVGSVIQSSLQPMFVPVSTRRLISGGNRALLRQFRTVTRLTVLLSAPVYAIFVATAPSVMGLFGPSFAPATNTLVLLCFAFALDGAAGPATAVLTVAGAVRKSTTNLCVAFLAQLVLLATLVPVFSGEGAAVALAGTFVIVESLQLRSVRRHLNVAITDVLLLRALALAFALLLTAVLVGLSREGVLTFAIGLVSICVYILGAFRLALSPEELAPLNRALRNVVLRRRS